MADKINLTVSSKKEDIAEYMSVVRLTTSAIASKIGFDIEEIDDMKVSIGEACTNIIKHGLNEKCDSFNIEYDVHKDKLTISVKDNGDGLEEEYIGKIFDRFYRGNTTLRGYGIGLNLSKTIIENHKGEIEARSDRGLIFQIKFYNVT